MTLKGIIFDLDGTLIDTMEAYTDAFNHGLRLYGVDPISRERLAGYLNQGWPLDRILADISPQAFADPQVRARCQPLIREAYRTAEASKVVPKPGVAALLARLRQQGCRIGIVTGRMVTGDDKWRELRRLGLDGFIESMVTGGEAERKPKPGGLLKCLNELGLTPPECLLVGDSQADLEAGQAAGMGVVAIAAGVAHRGQLESRGALAILGSLEELDAWLESRSLGGTVHKELFTFAAKVGSLEGYLYDRDQVEPLENWVSNLETGYHALPAEARNDIRQDLTTVLGRAITYGQKAIKPEIKARLEKLLAEVRGQATPR